MTTLLQLGVGPISGSRDSEINIDGLPDYRMGESADVEEIDISVSFNWKKHGHVNRRKLIYRVFNFNLKKRSCC